MAIEISKIDEFNAVSNADHIFQFKEEGTPFKIVKILGGENGYKIVVKLRDGTFRGVYTNSPSAIEAFTSAETVFGDNPPVMRVKMRETGKKLTVYYLEVVGDNF